MTGKDFEAHLRLVGFSPYMSRRITPSYWRTPGSDYVCVGKMAEQDFMHNETFFRTMVRYFMQHERAESRLCVEQANKIYFNYLPDEYRMDPAVFQVLKHCT